MTVVTPSRWLAACAAESALFHDKRILVIPNSLDLNQYKPADKRHARGLLSLPQDKSLVLFGAVQSTSTARKGFPMLADALRILSRMDQPREIDAVIFGASAPEKPFDFCLKTHYLGQVNDDARLALLYAAADVFVAPSIQENLANTVMESLACGTPCVAFDIGGMPDMIEHEVNGYLVKPYEVDDFARGIAWVLEDQRRLQELSRKARQRVETSFSIESVARRYVSLYHEILSQ
jgi:glycosyltransferase involved in cell wall biosynthesis